MSHILKVGNRSWRVRLYVVFVFTSLITLGATMVTPFMITVSSSTTNDFDYNRFSPLPRYFFSSEDRFVKGLVKYFNGYRGWTEQFTANMPGVPEHWAGWMAIGQDTKNVDQYAKKYLGATEAEKLSWRICTADYAAFCAAYPVEDCVVAVQRNQAVEFLQARYEKLWQQQNPGADVSGAELQKNALDLLSKTWGVPFENFFNIEFKDVEMKSPMDFQTWYPAIGDPKYDDFLRVKQAYKFHLFTPGVQRAWLSRLDEKGIHYNAVSDVFPVDENSSEALQAEWLAFMAEDCPAPLAVPYALRAVWLKYLQSDDALKTAGLDDSATFTVDVYNKLAGSSYASLYETPFPVPQTVADPMQVLWQRFVQTRYPLRLVQIEVTPELQQQYGAFLQSEIKHLRVANELLGTHCAKWEEFALTAMAPAGEAEAQKNLRGVWMNFVKTLPIGQKILSSSEIEYQTFLLRKYETLSEINKAYGWNIATIEEAFPPLDKAYAITFTNHETAFSLEPVLANYRIIGQFLTGNSKAVQVTVILIVLTLCMTLTVNPLAAYALSRFNMRGRDKIIMYLLATMAFPAMVSAIPAYLLMRDLGMLNTFLALLLPHAANGMAIFILKGFFDSLPQELFEAATIDGASELQIFRVVAMPLVKPILAINCMNAFIMAYNGWQWALTICQEKEMWTIAVWLYQASEWWKDMPWLVSAGFVVASVPTFLVFLSCQKIILKGIAIPSMK